MIFCHSGRKAVTATGGIFLISATSTNLPPAADLATATPRLIIHNNNNTSPVVFGLFAR